jgi:hypothetical protein
MTKPLTSTSGKLYLDCNRFSIESGGKPLTEIRRDFYQYPGTRIVFVFKTDLNRNERLFVRGGLYEFIMIQNVLEFKAKFKELSL